MINLPFIMKFDFDFEKELPSSTVTDNLLTLTGSISPNPVVNLYLSKINKKIYDFIIELAGKSDLKINLINPLRSSFLNPLFEKFSVNVEITQVDYDFDLLKKYNYNLTIPVGINKNLYEFIKSKNDFNINKITVKNTYCDCSAESILTQISLIKTDVELSKKCFLLPYFEENELKNFYDKEKILRPFLMCSSLWLNPVIDSRGKIKMPCFCSENTVNDFDFFTLWNGDDINLKREQLKDLKRFEVCKYCENFYKDNFFVVEDGCLEYKGKKYIFNDVLNPVLSAPIIGIISENDICVPISLYSDEDINIAYNKYDLKMVIRQSF